MTKLFSPLLHINEQIIDEVLTILCNPSLFYYHHIAEFNVCLWSRTQDINMQLPSLPSHRFTHNVLDNNSCKCQPDPYCLSSIPELLFFHLQYSSTLPYPFLSFFFFPFSLYFFVFICPLTIVFVVEQI